MRWESFVAGYQSLWESESDNAELDERRELVRADRASTPFFAVLCERVTCEQVVALINRLESPVHISQVGASWVQGRVCGTAGDVIIPLEAVRGLITSRQCDCGVATPRIFRHVTFGAKLRAIERAGTRIVVSHSVGGVRGRIVAVWQDAIDVLCANGVTTIRFGDVHSVSFEGS